jgi:hypothetical protein
MVERLNITTVTFQNAVNDPDVKAESRVVRGSAFQSTVPCRMLAKRQNHIIARLKQETGRIRAFPCLVVGGADYQPPSTGHGVPGTDNQVENDLFHTGRIDPDPAQIRILFDLEIHILTNEPHKVLSQAHQGFVQIESNRLHYHPPVVEPYTDPDLRYFPGEGENPGRHVNSVQAIMVPSATRTINSMASPITIPYVLTDTVNGIAREF